MNRQKLIDWVFENEWEESDERVVSSISLIGAINRGAFDDVVLIREAINDCLNLSVKLDHIMRGNIK